MSALSDEEVVLALLEYDQEHHADLSAGQHFALPPDIWVVGDELVPGDQRARATQLAADARYIEVAYIGNDVVPKEITAKGRAFVREWGRRDR